jgi:co-chaperonin GroES (HSP10)
MADTSISAGKAQNNEAKVVSLKKAYVNREEKILDPDKLDESSLDRLPKPTGWRLLILPYRGKGKTGGGVLLPDQTIERESVATVCGYVLAVGPLAYKDRNKFGNPDDPHENWQPWCAEKDWVIFGRYSGARFKIDGGEVRILNDDEVIAVIQDPEDILHF